MVVPGPSTSLYPKQLDMKILRDIESAILGLGPMMDPFQQAFPSTESNVGETLGSADLPTGFLVLNFYIYSAFWTESICLTLEDQQKSLLALPPDASPVVEHHHGSGMGFYSSHLRFFNTPVVLRAQQDLGLQRRMLYFQLSCRPASGLWGISFIVFFLLLSVLYCWFLK